ncbi:MAG: amidohydrolase family protein [Acidobacteriaceae bacterium]|nr:amidohydrolase family protein [Acidobacteriaceae bacterium]
MIIDRRRFLQLSSSSAAISLVPSALGKMTQQQQPIIDVHLHAYPDDLPIPAAVNPATGKAVQLKDGAAHRASCLAEMKRLNIVKAVVSGGDGDRLAAAYSWCNAEPNKIIAGAGVRGSADTPLPELDVLRSAFKDGRLRVLGEVTTQYAGITLDDPKYAAYLALAEELDIPVALHTGTMPPGMSFDPCCRTARARLGDPILVEEALNRYPKLRLNLMHAGWPYLDDTISTLFHYPQVNADLGAIDWLLPRAEFYHYLQALMRAGFGKRLMFGTDQMYWPEGIAMAVDAVQSAPFLSADEKRDIFYNNAAKFYRLA